MRQISPWLASNGWLLFLGLLPAVILIGALIYFTGWAFAFSFTDLELVGR
jgi:multiple sugar transport system permease protein